MMFGCSGPLESSEGETFYGDFSLHRGDQKDSMVQSLMKELPATFPASRKNGPVLRLPSCGTVAVWGLICVETLKRVGVPFDLLSSKEVACGALERHRVLLCRGWASHKVRALGEAGKTRIREFIANAELPWILRWRGPGSFQFTGSRPGSTQTNVLSNVCQCQWRNMDSRTAGPSHLERTAAGRSGLHLVPSHSCPNHSRSRLVWLLTWLRSGFWVADLPLSDLKDDAVPWQEWRRFTASISIRRGCLVTPRSRRSGLAGEG